MEAGREADRGTMKVSNYAINKPMQGSESLLSPVVCWAFLGAVSCLFSVAIFGQWLASEEFSAVPLSEADAMPVGGVLKIRIVELISTAVALWAFYHYLLKPWQKSGEFRIEGLLLVGALVTYVLDTSINYFGYFMAWNKHAINWGSWGGFFPGHTGPTRYAEALLWGPPMYVYFGVALATIQSWVINKLRGGLGLGFAVALMLSFPVVFLFDLLAESAIIRTEAYAWPNTIGALTLWRGEQYQFPLYESLLVGIYASMYTLLMYSARPDGTTWIERGAERFSGGSRLLVRFLAATGFAMLCTAFYFVGFGVFSLFADNNVAMPEYLMYLP